MAMLDEIMRLGDDQKSNQFEVIFSNIPGSSLDTKMLSLRIDQSFDIPNVVVGEYEFYVRGFKVTRPSMLDETDKHISFQVRVDQKWEVADALYKWKKLVFDGNNASASAASAIYGDTFSCNTMTIGFLDSQNKSKEMFILRQVILKEIQTSSLDPSSNDPTRLTLNFIFGDIDMAKQA
jgi:hypothetical protein